MLTESTEERIKTDKQKSCRCHDFLSDYEDFYQHRQWSASVKRLTDGLWPHVLILTACRCDWLYTFDQSSIAMADVYKAVLARLNERTLAIHSNAALHQELQQATIELLELKSVLARVREVQSAGVQLAQGEQIVNTTPRFQDVVIDIHTLQQQLTSKMRRLAGPQAPQSPVISHEAEAVVAEDSGVPAQAIDLCVESSDNEETAPVTQGSDGRGNEAFPIALNLREKRTLGSISKKIEMLMTSCLDQKQQQQQTKQSRGTRFRCVILSFERIIIQALGSRNERIQNAVAAHPDLRTSIQILMKQIVSLKSKVLSAVAAEMMLKTIALVPVKSKALHSALHRYVLFRYMRNELIC